MEIYGLKKKEFNQILSGYIEDCPCSKDVEDIAIKVIKELSKWDYVNWGRIIKVVNAKKRVIGDHYEFYSTNS
jgi:hypothetical protein